MKHTPSRTCITCHAEKLGEPVTAQDCLGFAECETCTKIPVNQEEAAKAWSEWLTEMLERENELTKQKKERKNESIEFSVGRYVFGTIHAPVVRCDRMELVVGCRPAFDMGGYPAHDPRVSFAICVFCMGFFETMERLGKEMQKKWK